MKKAPFENMTEKPDPGSARLGNFINYYEFNPAEERVRHIDKTLFDNLEDANGLDIGCNSGVCKNYLTILIHLQQRPSELWL